jgi:hypothetical protein
MPTGRNRGVGFGWGAYGRGKRWGKHDMSAKHIRSFSLTQENSRYLDGVTKGHRSDAVNRAIETYRGTEGMNVPDLLKNIEGLQAVIKRLNQELNQIPGAREIANNEAQKVPQSRGIRAMFHFLRSFWL